MKLIRWFIFGVFVFVPLLTEAQDIEKDIYRLEIGVSGGGDYYLGEANSLMFNNMRVAYGGYLRYKFNPRLAIRAELNRATVAGNGIDNTVYVGDVCGEFNFFDLERNKYKRYSKLFAPYIFTGVSVFTDVYNKQKLPEIGIPFGVGLKIKLKNRWNLDFKWTNRLLLADNLEGTVAPKENDTFNNPNGLNGSNIFNNDLLSTFTIGISFDIWKKECDCMNSNNSKR
jgi:hypothetical protein